jgi:FkbM family methyltransferase
MVSPYAKKVLVVTAGMDPGRFPWPPPAVDETLRRPSKTSMLFAGIPEEWMKGFHVLRDACSQLWRRRQDFDVMATGDPSPDSDPFVRYVGWQSQEDLPKFLHACDILVMPTIAQEALGRTAVEAMAAARPVVASRIGGLQFTVLDGATGLLCAAGNAVDLACKLESLIDEPTLRKRLGLAGRQRFDEHFSWPVIIERHYRPLLTIPQRVISSGLKATSMKENQTGAMRECTIHERVFPMVLSDRTAQISFPSRGAVDDAILNDLWVRDVYGLRNILRPPSCVVDIGAHVGAFTAQVKALWPDTRVVACEADPQNAELLRRTVGADSRVEIVEAAIVADDADEVTFFAMPDKTSQNSGGGSINRPEPGSVPITVRACSVTSMWEVRDIKRCNLLKLDCEGGEVPILQALANANLLGSIDCVVGEWHAVDGRAETCDAVMQALESVLGPTHDVEFDRHRPGREGHFTARRHSATGDAKAQSTRQM